MEVSDASRRILAGLLEARTGQQLAVARRWRVDTALAPLLREGGFSSVDQLVTQLVSGSAPALTQQVIEALLNNETYFFRDKLPFDLLLGGPLQRIEQARGADKRIAIWCAGCSTGQEVYSLAMAFAEQPLRWRGWCVEIVGTDISRSAVERAKAGVYSQFEVQRGLPVVQMVRWFGEAGGGAWRIADRLRDAVRFEVRAIAERPPAPGRFDVILCRNVFLYFSADSRRRTFDRLADALAPHGALMLGAGETVIGQTDRFASDPEHRGLYLARDAAAPDARRRVA